MVGRALLFMLCLQPILLPFFILSLFPGRDTQDLFQVDIECTYYFGHLYASMFMTVMATLFSGFLQTGRACLLFLFSLLFSALSQAPSLSFHRFMRKHGRWKHSKFFPSCFLLLSSVSLSPIQVTTAWLCQPGRARSVLSYVWEPPSMPDSMDSFFTMDEAFNMAVDDTCPQDSFFMEDVFDL